MTTSADVSSVAVDSEGVRVSTADEVVLDVQFDGRRIWSFWVHRDGTPEHDSSRYFVAWPGPLQRYLDGRARVAVLEHVSEVVAFDEEVRFGESEQQIAVVDPNGRPLGIDKSGRLAQTFDTRSEAQVAPLLDSIKECLQALGRAGVQAFPAYGTLLGAVRGGRLIGHDSDADLGYVSEHTHPVDVVLESFGLQRALAAMGYRISRYSGAAFKIDVEEADGSLRGLDVFGGFFLDDQLVLMGEIRTPFRREWVYPLGTTTLEGRELPAPADTDRFLTATYGPHWRVPDPAYKFLTPESTHRRLNGWFRGTRVKRENWDRTYGPRKTPPPIGGPSPFAEWVRTSEGRDPERVVDLGCGRGHDAVWFARRGACVVGFDFAPDGWRRAEDVVRAEELDLRFRTLNLCELRSVLSESAGVAHTPGTPVVLARHLADATDAVGRAHLWRACEMMLRGGGRLYLQFVTRAGGPEDPFVRANHLRVLRHDLVVRELRARGAKIVSETAQAGDDAPAEQGHRVSRMVVEWRR